MKKAAVIGGGITGLSAAFYLQKNAQEQQVPLDVTVFEASERLGGKVNTLRGDGFIIERGADSFVARKKPGIQLVEDLGLEDQMFQNQTGRSYVLVKNQLKQIPAGSYMGLPVQEEPFRNSDIVSEEAKDRVLREVNVPKGPAQTDQSLGGFFRRRFGDELVDHVLSPLLSGIYSSDIDDMSLMASFPDFYELEQTYGSVLKGLRETMSPAPAGTGKKTSKLRSFEGGLSTVIQSLEKELGSNIKKETPIRDIETNGHSYRLHDAHGEIYEADTVILALPHKEIPELLDGAEAVSPLEDIPVKSVANVVLGFNEEDIDQTMDGTGFVVSRTSDVRITACTWTHKKWPHTTPNGKAMLRAYVGRPTDQEVVTMKDEDIVQIVLDDLKKVMNLQATPEFSVVTRWKELMPQYMVGHQQRVDTVMQKAAQDYPGLFFAGASYHGVGVPDCIYSAKQAQEAALNYLKD